MHVTKISALNKPTATNQTSFKSREIFDIGASNKKRGTLKIRLQNNEGKDLFEYSGFVSGNTDGFRDNHDFVKKVARAVDVEGLIKKDIEQIESQLQEGNTLEEETHNLKTKLQELKANQVILQSRNADEKKLTKFALLLPGTIQGKTALFMANLLKTNNESLVDVKLEDVISEIKEQGKVPLSENFDINRDFIPCKDLAGTGLGIAQKIAIHPEYSKRFDKGFLGIAVQTGGGFGAVDIKLKDDFNVDIETNESGHDLFYDKKIKKEVRLGKIGASAGSVIDNFAKKFGIKNPESISALMATGNARIATDTQIKLNNKKDAAAIDVLMKTKAYKIVNQNAENTILQINNKSANRFNKASKYAIDAYADAISLHAITKITQGANLYVVSGPLAMGLNERIEKAPELFNAKNMRELIFKFIDERIQNDVTCNILRKANNFDIVCDKSMSIANNTFGGSLLLAGETKTFARRGEWMSIPIKVLKGIV